MRRFLRLGSLILAAAALAGCGGAAVHNEVRSGAAAAPAEVVYVGDFDLGAAQLKSDPGTLTGWPRLLPALRGDDDPAVKAEKLQDALADDLVSDLRQAGFGSVRLEAGGPRPTEGWLVSGQFLELSQGNRAQQAVVGFGAGDSDAKLYVTLADLAHPEGQNLLNFDADTTANRAPGGGVTAVATHSPWGIVAKYALSRNASEKDMKHIAQAICDEIMKFSQGK